MARIQFKDTLYVDVENQDVFLDLQTNTYNGFSMDEPTIYSLEEVVTLLQNVAGDPDGYEKQTPVLLAEVLTVLDKVEVVTLKHKFGKTFNGNVVFQPGW